MLYYCGMDVYGFNQLCLNERIDIALQCAFIQTVDEGTKRYSLYRSALFFIEVEYLSEENTISSVYAFVNNQPLARYIKQIDISGLYNA